MINTLNLKYDDYWTNSFYPKIALFVEYEKIKKIYKSKIKLIYSILTACAVAQISYAFISPPIAILMSLGIIIHELGHYMYGKAFNAKASYPLFIPVPFLLIGLTHIADIDPANLPMISMAGLLLEFIYILFMIFYNSFYKFYSVNILIIYYLISFIFNYFGFDGKKYRQAKQK